LAEESTTSIAPSRGQPPQGLPLDYAGPTAEDQSVGARIADTALWIAAWMLALTVLGAICFVPAMCESPGLLRYLD
jgi:hypothetical protein